MITLDDTEAMLVRVVLSIEIAERRDALKRCRAHGTKRAIVSVIARMEALQARLRAAKPSLLKAPAC